MLCSSLVVLCNVSFYSLIFDPNKTRPPLRHETPGTHYPVTERHRLEADPNYTATEEKKNEQFIVSLNGKECTSSTRHRHADCSLEKKIWPNRGTQKTVYREDLQPHFLSRQRDRTEDGWRQITGC